jgi:hypothetical protein
VPPLSSFASPPPPPLQLQSAPALAPARPLTGPLTTRTAAIRPSTQRRPVGASDFPSQAGTYSVDRRNSADNSGMQISVGRSLAYSWMGENEVPQKTDKSTKISIPIYLRYSIQNGSQELLAVGTREPDSLHRTCTSKHSTARVEVGSSRQHMRSNCRGQLIAHVLKLLACC